MRNTAALTDDGECWHSGPPLGVNMHPAYPPETSQHYNMIEDYTVIRSGHEPATFLYLLSNINKGTTTWEEFTVIFNTTRQDIEENWRPIIRERITSWSRSGLKTLEDDISELERSGLLTKCGDPIRNLDTLDLDMVIHSIGLRIPVLEARLCVEGDGIVGEDGAEDRIVPFGKATAQELIYRLVRLEMVDGKAILEWMNREKVTAASVARRLRLRYR